MTEKKKKKTDVLRPSLKVTACISAKYVSDHVKTTAQHMESFWHLSVWKQ